MARRFRETTGREEFDFADVKDDDTMAGVVDERERFALLDHIRPMVGVSAAAVLSRPFRDYQGLAFVGGRVPAGIQLTVPGRPVRPRPWQAKKDARTDMPGNRAGAGAGAAPRGWPDDDGGDGGDGDDELMDPEAEATLNILQAGTGAARYLIETATGYDAPIFHDAMRQVRATVRTYIRERQHTPAQLWQLQQQADVLESGAIELPTFDDILSMRWRSDRNIMANLQVTLQLGKVLALMLLQTKEAKVTRRQLIGELHILERAIDVVSAVLADDDAAAAGGGGGAGYAGYARSGTDFADVD